MLGKFSIKNLWVRRGALSDIAYIYIAYSFRFLSPLLLYPHLTRQMGADRFGVFATIYSLAIMVSIVVEYGFNLSATRDVAVASTDVEKGKIASLVLLSRVVLVPFAIIFGYSISYFSSVVSGKFDFIALACILGVAQGFSSFWFFQGVRRAAFGVFLEVGFQVSALIASFIFVRSPADLVLAIDFQIASAICIALVGLFVLFRAAPFVRCGGAAVVKSLRDGFVIFLSRTAVIAYTTSAVFIVSATSGSVEAALYGAAERISGAAIAMLRPFSAITLPTMARKYAQGMSNGTEFSAKVFWAGLILYSSIALALAMISSIAVPLYFGAEFSGSISVLNVLCISLPLIAANSVLNSQVMVILKMDKAIFFLTFVGAAANLILVVLLSREFGALGTAIGRLGAEISILLMSLTLLWLRSRAQAASA